MRLACIAALAILLPSIALGQSVPAAGQCDSLVALSMPSMYGGNALNVTLAAQVAAGAFPPPAAAGRAGGAAAFAQLPPFCRVVATLKPSRNSTIGMELWMPASGWNGKLE